MPILTRRATIYGALATSAAAWAGGSLAQEKKYPISTMTLVTHSRPGAGADLFNRKLGKALGKELEINVTYDYWSGGSGAKALAQLAKSRADGSVFYGTTPTHITTSLLSKPAVTFREIDYIANVFFDPEVIYALADSPFKTMKDAVERSKSNPGKAKWGGSSPGSLERQILERINAHSKAGAVVVPHDDGAGLMISVLNGTVDLGVGELQEIKGYLQSGKMKVLGVYFPDRLKTLPDVPTILEMGLDDQAIRKFRGLAAPKGVSADVVGRIERAIKAILADPAFEKEYLADGLVAGFMGQHEYRAFMSDFAQKQEQFLKEFGVTSN